MRREMDYLLDGVHHRDHPLRDLLDFLDRCLVLNLQPEEPCVGFRVRDSEFSVWVVGFEVPGLGLRVEG